MGNDQKTQKTFDKFPLLESIARKIVENAFIEYQHNINTYLVDTPEQRYIRLIESRPDLIQPILQYQLANYIRVKPDSLSRIRKRIAKNR